MNEVPSFEDSNGTKYLRLMIVMNEIPSFEDSNERNTYLRLRIVMKEIT